LIGPVTSWGSPFIRLIGKKAKGAASEHATPFSEITDDDIDALFG